MPKVESPRPLTDAERGILEFILAQEWGGAEQVRALLRNTRASVGCECGCGSIDLTVDPPGEPLRLPLAVPAEAFAHVDGHPFHALLFIAGDSAYLEFVWSGDPASRLPKRDELEVAP